MEKLKRGVRLVGVLLFAAISCTVNAQTEQFSEWTLQNCIDYAKEHNINIQKSRISAVSSGIDVKTARAELFPNLSFSTSHNYANQPFIDEGKKNVYSGNYGLNASWAVYNGGKNTKTVKQNKLNSQIADLEVEEYENDIEVSITQMYLQILYATESVRINENTVEVTEGELARAKELFNVGSIAKSDYVQIEAQLSSDRYQLVNSKSTLQNYKLQLKQLLELTGEDEMTLALPKIDDEDVLVPLPTKTEVYMYALKSRPEIESGKLNVEASDLAVSIARAGYIPTLSLSAGIGTGHNSGSDYTFEQQIKNSWSNSIGVTVSVPIFNNRQTKSAVQKAKLQYESSKLDLLNEEKNLYSTVEGYWLDATTAQQRYVAAKEQLNSSLISYEMVNERFMLGMKNTVELLSEKNNLLSAQQELIQTKYMAAMSILLLKFYQGEPISIK